MLLLKSFLITVPILGILSLPNYYWRHYDGRVPPDAVTAGDKLYIGRAPFERGRMLVGQITAGVRRLSVTSSSKFNKKSVHIVEDDLIEILCSPPPHTYFQWVTATPETVTNISGKVEGGYEPINDGDTFGVLHIGRIHYGRTFKVGKVVGYYPFKRYRLSNIFYYASDGGTEAYEYSWEVLVYNAPRDTCAVSPKTYWSPDYYWRKYDGELPCDALWLYKYYDYYRGSVYIGRGQLNDKGLLVGPISSNAKYVIVTYNFVTYPKIHTFVEILCGRTRENMRWVTTTSEKLLDVKGLIIGGFEKPFGSEYNGVLYIGAKWNGKYKIGKVLGYHKKTDANWKDNHMYYDQNNKEVATDSFSVLTFGEK